VEIGLFTIKAEIRLTSKEVDMFHTEMEVKARRGKMQIFRVIGIAMHHLLRQR
jgi:hypothetical protein